jgi:protein TonB
MRRTLSLAIGGSLAGLTVSCVRPTGPTAPGADPDGAETTVTIYIRALPDDAGALPGNADGPSGPRGCDGEPLAKGEAPPRIERPTPYHVAPLILSAEAFARKVHGTAMIKCTFNVDGSTSDCSIVKSLPFMDEQILASVREWRFKPAMLCGHPQRVEMTFPLFMSVPRVVAPHRD